MNVIVPAALTSYDSNMHTYRRDPSYTHTHTHTHTGTDGHIYTRACTCTLTQSKCCCSFAANCILVYPLDNLTLSDKALKGLKLDNFQNC